MIKHLKEKNIHYLALEQANKDKLIFLSQYVHKSSEVTLVDLSNASSMLTGYSL